ncbi:glycosyltransferase family 2 protein [Helicobacter sp.]|uniref:glycosyltransferase family 2 protein n=1 Tax=Helicobacter sp. TaxID=218 RepID=UPI0025B82135|nr:glycosyltransferase family 2 protein [Helicobacter sp.]MCI5968478.1 glycosyltransferase family 2 protein [Helicobacter sp.]MDY2585263.1 glycosyltransferase family 2 protein [Helicobacter sp.]
MEKISAVILTKNSSRLLREVLEALESLDEVVILDNGSSDSTLEIAKSFKNTSIHHHTFIGFGAMKKLGANLAKNDWILTLDSDEIASKELIDEIASLKLNPNYCYTYDVKNYFNGKHIYSCGWGNDRCIGLYHKCYFNFNTELVHESIIPLSNRPIQTFDLKGYITHYPYENLESFLDKMQKYSTLFAKEKCGKKQSSIFKAITHSTWCFVKNYFLQKGILQGYEGFVIASYNAQTAFWKYLKLYENNKKL